eukprot:134880_1
MFLGVTHILPNVVRYKSVLEQIDSINCNVQNIDKIINMLNKYAIEQNVSCVINKIVATPQSICVHKNYNDKQYILYDPHSRSEKEFNGSHFLIFADPYALNLYLQTLFPFINLNGDMINQCEASYIRAMDSDKCKDIIHQNSNKQTNNELSLLSFKSRSKIDNANEIEIKTAETDERN